MASVTWGTAFRHLRYIFGSGSLAGLGDGALLARYASTKDEVAFETLMNRHGPMVLATCRAILRNEHDVEDAFQATFLILARKAGSIREGDSLAAWLHRVAYRASVQASVEAVRQRRKEAEASAMIPPKASHPGLEPAHDWKPILHEEIGRLPEGQRLPVVLCDLEGLTYEQAALQLGWTEPTLRCRLAKARQRLRDRLTRRGVTALGVGALLASQGASTALAVEIVPPALLRATMSAVAGGSASSGAMLLTHVLLRGMLMTKIKVVSTAALAALAFAAAGMMAAGGGSSDDAKPAQKAQAPASAAPEKPAPGKPGETVEVRGIVETPDGKPVAGAAVRAVYPTDETGKPQTTSGSDGRFAIRLSKPGRGNVGYRANYPFAGANYPRIIASAPGFGIGWVQEGLGTASPAEQVLKLTPEGPSIEGKVVDLEGRPVAGARAKLRQLWFEAKGDMAGWIARARSGSEGYPWEGLQKLTLEKTLPIEAVTGPDGQFRLTGVGRDRIAELIITGPGIATTPAYVLSRDEPEVRMVDRGMMTASSIIVHAPKFQVALSSSKQVEGIARDKDSGSPIAGLEIHAAVFDERNPLLPFLAGGIEVTTDAQGHYRLDGLPKAAAYRLLASPGKGLPYFLSSMKVPADSPGLTPIRFDFTLKRGLFVRGKVTNKVTGEPASGYAVYYAFADNPHVRDYALFAWGYAQYSRFDEEGRYELAVLPGRGLIAVRDEENNFLPASGYEGIKGYDPQFQRFATVPQSTPARSFAVLSEIDVAPDAGDTTRNLQVDPGRSVAIEVVGPDGQPVEETKVKGMSGAYATAPYPQESAHFEVQGLAPGKPRRVVVMHEARKLIGAVLLKGNETGPIVVKLQPWGTVSGRIVDEEGNPRKGMFLGSPDSPDGTQNKRIETHDILPGSDWNSGVRVGDDGRFRVEGLVPGLRYSAVSRIAIQTYGDLFKDVVVSSGETKDLGDLKVQAPKK